MVMVYLGQSAERSYRLPAQPELDDRRLVYRGQYAAGEIGMHIIIEIAENSADFAHFFQFHGTMRIPWTNIRLPWISIRYELSWSLDDEFAHVSYLKIATVLEISSRAFERTRSRTIVTFLGPGSIMQFDFQVPGIGKIVMFQTHTPVEALRQRVIFRWFAARRVPRILVSYVIGNWVSQWRQDVGIWQEKIYRREAADGSLLGRARAWYEQFYPRGCRHGD